MGDKQTMFTSIILAIELLLPFCIATFAFSFGFEKLKKVKALYFKIYVFAAGCIALAFLSLAVMTLCGFKRALLITELISLFGCGFFLLSANYGTIDKIVDETSNINKKKKLMACMAPIILGVVVVGLIFFISDAAVTMKIGCFISLLPILPASYYNLKHLLIKKDDFNILKSTKYCNIVAISLYISMILFVCFGLMKEMFIFFIILAINILVLVIVSVKGAKKWLI